MPYNVGGHLPQRPPVSMSRPLQPDPLHRIALKLTRRSPDQLDAALLASLRKMLDVYDRLQVGRWAYSGIVNEQKPIGLQVVERQRRLLALVPPVLGRSGQPSFAFPFLTSAHAMHLSSRLFGLEPHPPPSRACRATCRPADMPLSPPLPSELTLRFGTSLPVPQSVQGYVRPGCTQLVLDLLSHSAGGGGPGGGVHVAAGGGGASLPPSSWGSVATTAAGSSQTSGEGGGGGARAAVAAAMASSTAVAAAAAAERMLRGELAEALAELAAVGGTGLTLQLGDMVGWDSKSF